MTIVCIIPGASHEYARKPAGDKWCFNCRKRLPHDFVLMGDPPDVETYYESQWDTRCSQCHQDYTQFPGAYA